MSAEEMAEAMYPESEMTYGYQAVREAFECGYAAAKRVQPSREDAVRAIRAADWWPVDAPHGLDGIAADAVLALFAHQPTVAEVKAEAWDEGYYAGVSDYRLGKWYPTNTGAEAWPDRKKLTPNPHRLAPLPPNPYGESEARS